MSDGLPQYLAAIEIAERLRVHPKTVLGWICASEFKTMRAGKSWRLLEPDVLAFVEASAQAECLERAERFR